MALPPVGVAQSLYPSQAVASAGPNSLEIQVLDGEGGAYPVGSKASRGVTVLITDETKRPVAGVTVGFTLPTGGPGGIFATGARTEIVTTQADGKATVRGMQWNQSVGPFEIRITAVKGQTRAGILLPANLVDSARGQGAAIVGRTGPAPAAGAAPAAPMPAIQAPVASPAAVQITQINRTSPQVRSSNKTSHKWLWVGLAVGGAAAAGAVGFVNKSGTAAASSAGIGIGTPTVTLGH